MTDIIVATHGGLAEGMVDALELIIGKQENIWFLGLRHEDSIDTFIKRVDSFAADTDHDILFMTVLLGASSYNASAQAIDHNRDKHVVCVSGINLSMLVEAALKRNDMKLDELADYLVETGKQGIAKLSLNMERGGTL